MTTVSIEQLAAIAERVGEAVEHVEEVDDVKTAAQAPNAVLLCNILSTICRAQPRLKKLEHMIRYTRDDGKIVFHVMKVCVLDATAINALRNLSPRILGMRFQFTSLQSGAPLDNGTLIFDILHTSVQRIAAAPVYVEPTQRRSRAVEIDWSDNIVLVNDRKAVLAVIDDVYNMHQLMPGKITVSIETIDDADYTRTNGVAAQTAPALSKRKRNADDAISETVSQSAVPLLGYCLHFVGVPSFDDNFLVHMAQKYATRWLGGTIIFPRRMNKSNILVPCQLLVSLGCEHALVQASQPRAICGAKRLCKKMVESAGAE